MKLKKKLIALVATLGILGVAGTAYAAELKTPADIVASLTGKTVEEVSAERATGKTYGTIANEAGELDQYKQETLQQKKAILDQRVQEGTLTQQQADTIYSGIQENQITCDGTGTAQIGKKNGAGFGMGAMQGQGRGQGFGRGMGSGSYIQ
jgi:hypothetical protein